MAQFQFNANEVTPDSGQLDPLPAGWYVVQAVNSEIVATSKGDGTRLNYTYEVLQGGGADGKNRKIFDGFNIRNPNPMAQEIAYKQYSALCHAIGHFQVQDTAELHNRPFKIKLKVVPAQMEKNEASGQMEEKYGAKNEPVAYKPLSEDVPLAAPPAGAAGAAGAVMANVPAQQIQIPVQQPMQQMPMQQPLQQPMQQMPMQQPVQMQQPIQPPMQAQQSVQQVQQPWQQAQQQPQVQVVQQQPMQQAPVQQVQQPMPQIQQQPMQQPVAIQQQPVQQNVQMDPNQQVQQQPVYAQQQVVDPAAQAGAQVPPWQQPKQ